MARGRPPKPTEQKRREGNPGKRKLPDNVIVGRRGAPTPRRGMSAKTRKVWDELVAVIEPSVLDQADAVALEALAGWVVAMRDAQRVVHSAGKNGGLTITQPSGRQARSPMVDVLDTATKNVRQLAEQFGLTPSARARLGGAGFVGPSAASVDPDIGESPRLRKIDGGRGA